MAAEPIRLELPFSAERVTVNAYLFLEPEPTLIDTGDLSDDTWAALLAALGEHGLVPADLRRILISHTHIDHFGNARRLADESSADFFILDVGYPWLTDFTNNWANRLDYYRQTFVPAMGLPPELADVVLGYSMSIMDRYRGVSADRVTKLHEGDQIEMGKRSWRVLHVPGHAPMLTCFHAEETGDLLASDMLLARTPTPVVEAPVDGERRPELPQFLRSLERVDALNLTLCHPGHGPTIHNPHELIARQRSRIDQRKQECLQHITVGASTPFDLLQKMYPHAGQSINMAGLWMLVGYLDILEAEGLIRRTEEQGVWTYQISSLHG